MMYNKYILILVISVIHLFFAPTNVLGQTSINKKKTRENISNLNFKIDTTRTEKDSLKVEIISYCLVDSIDFQKSLYIYPICSKQIIFIYKNKKLILKKENEFPKVTAVTTKGYKIKILETVYTNINLRKGNKGWYISLRGWSGCNWCKTYHEIFDINGKSIYLLIEDRSKIYKKKGNYEMILKKYGISKILTKEEKLYEKEIPSENSGNLP